MVCIETPKSILDDQDRDVFEEIIPDTEPYYDAKRSALWNMYKYRGIGSCDVDYWVDCMKARYYTVSEKYSVSFEMWRKFVDEQNKDFADGAAESTTTIEHEDNPDNPQGSQKYLASRDTTTYNGKTFGGLGSTTAAEYLKDIPNLPVDFAYEFRELFYWGM